jgi:hypothetical protein
MTKQHSGPFPALLRRRLKSLVFAGEREREVVFKALVEHYQLTEQHDEMLQKVKGLSPDTAARSVFWERLARSLMLDFVPAYQLNKRDGQLLLDWMQAGGNVLNFFVDLPRRQHFYQAQLVCLIQEQAYRKNRPREWVFRWFAHKEERGGSKERSRRTSLLPPRYRKRSTARSIREAFNRIPTAVRKRPFDYLPCGSRPATHEPRITPRRGSANR